MQKVENIAHLARLDTLLLDHNSLTRLAGLEYLKELKILSVTHNAIDTLDNLPAFSKVQIHTPSSPTSISATTVSAHFPTPSSLHLKPFST